MKKFTSGILFFVAMMFFLVFSAFAEEVTLTLEWNANTESFLGGYNAYVGDASGGPYSKFEDIKEPTVTIDYIYNPPIGVATTKYFVVTAYSDSDPPLESGYSNEVNWTYDFALIEVVTEFVASLEGNDVTFTWKQGDIGRVKKWKLYVSEVAGGEYTDLAVIDYTGEGGPQYSTTESMTVPVETMKTFYFVLVTFTPTGVFSDNSNEVSVTIDKRIPAPTYNLTIKIKAQ